MQFGARRVLHAMHRPEHLRQAGQLDLLARRAARMVGGEAAVIGRMPVLRGHDEVERRLKRLIAGTTSSPCGHRQGPAGAEVVLHIDDNQGDHQARVAALLWFFRLRRGDLLRPP